MLSSGWFQFCTLYYNLEFLSFRWIVNILIMCKDHKIKDNYLCNHLAEVRVWTLTDLHTRVQGEGRMLSSSTKSLSNPRIKPTNIIHRTWPLSLGSGSFQIFPLSFSLFLPSFPLFLSGQWKSNLDVYNYTGVSFSVYREKNHWQWI